MPKGVYVRTAEHLAELRAAIKLNGRPPTKHGHRPAKAPTPEYAAFYNARKRCEDPRNRGFRNYGARGVRFLFSSFLQWYAELGPKPTPAHSVDRRDNDGHYAPGNVRWATRSEQERNKRRYQKVAA